MTKQDPAKAPLPITVEQMHRLQLAIDDLSSSQLAWISGYLWGRVMEDPLTSVTSTLQTITVLSISQTGNARRIAELLHDDLITAKLNVTLINAGNYKFKHIDQEKLLLIITSTQGEGEPPEEAVPLYKYLFSKKAPTLSETQFAIFGLGDSSYENFAKIGKDFDKRLLELGAKRLHDRVDADVEYQTLAETWRRDIVDMLQKKIKTSNPIYQPPPVRTNSYKLKSIPHYTKDRPLTAHLAIKQKITSRNSLKNIHHLEIDLENTGLHYQPGDALGVWYENDPELISELLELICLKGNEIVQVKGNKLNLREALQKNYELTQNTPAIVEKYATLVKNRTLLTLMPSTPSQLQDFAMTIPIVDMIRHVPTALTPEKLLSLLRPLSPRSYSISSSLSEVRNEVHITVAVLQYTINDHLRTGGASGYLGERLHENEPIRVFIEQNNNFRLPSNPNSPVIMIGPGTGIAPFRAFMQQRTAEGAKGQNWLFFGNPHFIDDFLYQVEWQRYLKEGVLSHMDVAWSRDQKNKIYVQDRLREKGAEIWRWIQGGAHIYVCGNAKRMAHDVEQALLSVVIEHGCMNSEQADEYLSELRITRRYQRDIY